MNIVHYEPWTLLGRLHKDSDAGSWLPPVDIHEDAHQYLILVDVPGVDPQGVEITPAQGVLTIRGERRATPVATTAPTESYCRTERTFGEFQRRFSLPKTADTQHIRARCVNGVLEISIPKLAQVQPQRITVEAA